MLWGLVCYLLLSTTSHAELSLSAKSVLVTNVDSGEILYQKDENAVRPIASVTKMMTAVVIVSHGLPLDEIITITSDDAKIASLHGKLTGISLPIGLKLTREQLLHVMLMNSQNRAAAALGRTFPGGLSAFVQAMNDKAVELNMIHTIYVEPTGLDSNNKSTAADLTILLKYASNFDIIKEFSITKSYKLVAQRQFRSTNRLISQAGWNIEIQKTGFINQAGNCVIMIANVADQRIAMILLHSDGSRARALDAITIKHWLTYNTTPSKLDLQKADPYGKTSQKKHRRLPKAKSMSRIKK